MAYMCSEKGIPELKALAEDAKVMVKSNPKLLDEEEVKMLKEEVTKYKDKYEALKELAMKFKAGEIAEIPDLAEEEDDTSSISTELTDVLDNLNMSAEEADLGDDNEVEKFKEALAMP